MSMTARVSTNESAAETDSTRTASDTVRGSKQQVKLGGAIKRLFCGTARALTQRDPVPAPKKARRRRGETGQFRAAANRITSWRAWLPAATGALAYLADTLDWLQLWHPTIVDEDQDNQADSSPNHLFPHL